MVLNGEQRTEILSAIVDSDGRSDSKWYRQRCAIAAALSHRFKTETDS
jgi:hypothetical protein